LVKLKLLITGAGGLLGSAVTTSAVRKYEVYSAFNIHPPTGGTPIKLELLDTEQIGSMVKTTKPDAIIHAAALTDVDKCEREHDLADKVNHEATAVLSEAAKMVGAYLLYVSTDYVFDGTKGMYKEEDKTGPVDYYGLTKLRGEQSVKASGAEHCIARGSVVYGARPAAGKANFALWLIDRLRNGQRIRVLEDQYVCPTINLSFAQMILEATERRLTGTFHLAGATRVSRYEFAKALAETLDLDSDLLEPVLMKDMNWTAKRPRDSSLDVSKASSMLRAKPLPLSKALQTLKQAMIDTEA
jgi:dTDP-4-dehydrorhamnose reductase